MEDLKSAKARVTEDKTNTIYAAGTPVRVYSISLMTIVTMTTTVEASIFYKELMAYDQAIATSGTSLLIRVEQASNEAELSTIEDTRATVYTLT